MLNHIQTTPEAQTPIQQENNQEISQDQEIIPMTRMRKTIAQRLKEAQNTAAILTTFNEVDLSDVIDLRNRWESGIRKKNMASNLDSCLSLSRHVSSR